MYALPTSQQAIDELIPLIAALHVDFPRVLEESIKPYFARDERAFDEVTATFLFRDQIGHRLKLRNYDITEDSNSASEFSVRELALKGIEGSFGRWCFKVLRSRNGLIPPPRDSQRRADFYAQTPPLPGLEPWLNRDFQMRHNIVFLWNYDTKYSMFSLRIAMPLDGTGATTHFNEIVAQPEPEEIPDLAVRRKGPPETPSNAPTSYQHSAREVESGPE